MGLLSIFEITTTFAQYLGIITSVDIPWPESWQYYIAYLKYLRLDLSIPIPNVDIPVLEFRAYHLLLTNFLPLALSILLLVLFKPAATVLWFVAMLAGVGVFAAGGVLYFLPSKTGLSVSTTVPMNMMIGGGSLVFLMVVGWLIRRRSSRRKNKVSPVAGSHPSIANSTTSSNDNESMGSVPNVSRIARGQTFKPKSFLKQTRNFVISFVLVSVGLLSAELVPFQFGNYFEVGDSIDEFLVSVGFVPGVVMLAIGSALFYNWFSHLFYTGRVINTKMNVFFRANTLSIVLLTLSLLYIPLTSSIFSSMNCKQHTCEAGTEFHVRSVTLDFNSIISSLSNQNAMESEVCPSCNFDMDECSIAADLCPKVSDLRLMADYNTSCNNEMLPFFLPGSVFMLVSLTLGLPYLYFKVITVCKRFLDEIPVKGTQKEKWAVQAYFSRNSCRSLYADFGYDWRYYKLLMLLQKLLIVGIFVFAVSTPNLILLCMPEGGGCFPYRDSWTNVFAVICLLINGVNALSSFLLSIGVPVSDTLLLPLSLLNTLGPLVFIFVAFIANYYGASRMKKQARLAVLKKAQEEKLKAAERHKVLYAAQAKKAGSRGILDDDNGEFDAKTEIKKSAMVTDDGNLDNRAPSEMKLDDVKEELSPEEKKTEEFCRNLDLQLNKHLLTIIVNFFLFMGFTAFLALCAVLIGIIYQSTNANQLITADMRPAVGDTDFEFAGYKNWYEFTENCCCRKEPGLPYVNAEDHDKEIAERWKCKPASGKGPFVYKERLRKTRVRLDGSREWKTFSGLDIRPYCSTEFELVVAREPFFNDTSKQYQIRTHPSALNEQQIPFYAQAYLCLNFYDKLYSDVHLNAYDDVFGALSPTVR